ncbi:hypothetical protein F2Q70_00013870 [Brassica cretica]|uniref:Uncharacterized protein n=1 Tax=Brassica cretica TaxID=69181 RepID=A0A8S9LZS1_BRACR|nr:hypothetical protein F2Q70_00013870 [Brassica cretica]
MYSSSGKQLMQKIADLVPRHPERVKKQESQKVKKQELQATTLTAGTSSKLGKGKQLMEKIADLVPRHPERVKKQESQKVKKQELQATTLTAGTSSKTLSLRQSIFHVSIFNNLSHPSSPLLLSQSFLNNDDANEELWCDQPRCDQPLSHSQAEEEKLWCEKIYGLSLTAEEAETDMDSPPLQRREGKKTRCRRDGKRRWRRGRSGGDDNSEQVRALVWRGR